MSTRANIMIQVKDEGDGEDWAMGTYHHFDGYPSGLGRYLEDTFKEKGWKWLDEILKHSWSAIWDNVCHCCGTMSDGRKEDVSFLPSDTKYNGDTEYMYVFSKEAGRDILKTYETGRKEDAPNSFYGWYKIKELALS